MNKLQAIAKGAVMGKKTLQEAGQDFHDCVVNLFLESAYAIRLDKFVAWLAKILKRGK